MAVGTWHARKRTNALHALHNAGLITFVKSTPAPRNEGGRLYTIEVNGEERTLKTRDVDAFVQGMIAASGRTDIDLERPFPTA
ncbi:hypothetical protein [Streptomyces albogriseolus]|uniref:hypothetical protein n=1 Tax=Streptomyces albogriseolus TaxID=1887 RepID=UPI003460AEB3